MQKTLESLLSSYILSSYILAYHATRKAFGYAFAKTIYTSGNVEPNVVVLTSLLPRDNGRSINNT